MVVLAEDKAAFEAEIPEFTGQRRNFVKVTSPKAVAKFESFGKVRFG